MKKRKIFSFHISFSLLCFSWNFNGLYVQVSLLQKCKIRKKKNNEKTGEKKNKLKRRKKKKEKKKPILDFFLLFVFLIPSNLNRLIAYDTAPCVKIEKAMKLKEKKKTRKRRRKKNYDKIQFLRPHSFFLSYLL